GTTAGGHATLDAHAGITPRHQIDLALEEPVQIGVRREDQVAVRGAAVGRNRAPVLDRGVLQVVVGVEQPVAGGGPDHLDLGDLVVVHAQRDTGDIRLGV